MTVEQDGYATAQLSIRRPWAGVAGLSSLEAQALPFEPAVKIRLVKPVNCLRQVTAGRGRLVGTSFRAARSVEPAWPSRFRRGMPLEELLHVILHPAGGIDEGLPVDLEVEDALQSI